MSNFMFRASKSHQNASLFSRGFTLIELLVVIAIVGMLSGIGFYSVAEARVKAENARTLTQVRSFTNLIEAHKASTGEYPLTSGIVCLGGADCGTDSSAVLNAELEKSAPAGLNPMRNKVAFNTDGEKTYRAWYARCSDVSGYCEDDDIAEVVWYLEGTTADCGGGARKFVSEAEGNTACVYKLAGVGTVINQAALGYDSGDGPEPEFCADEGACNYESAGECDYSCIIQCTDTSSCNYGASESCDYSCLCNDPTACNYSGSSNGNYDTCDYSCQTQCTDSAACNNGAYELCRYDCCQDGAACNYLDPTTTYCDYSCVPQVCWDGSACNYGAPGECDYSSCYGGYCEDYQSCNYGAYGSCNYDCQCNYDSSACNYNMNGTGSCDYSCQQSYCWDGSACNYGATGECDYSCFNNTMCGDTDACNYGSWENCTYDCKCNYDSSACNFSWSGSGPCDYSCY